MKLEFSQQIFEKYCHNKFHENPPTETQDKRTDGRADSHNETDSCFRNFGNASKNELTPHFGNKIAPPPPSSGHNNKIQSFGPDRKT